MKDFWRLAMRSGRSSIAGLLLFGVASAALAQQPPAVTAPPQSATTDLADALQQQMRALARAHSAVVGLRSIAVEDAQSAKSLGRQRRGSGVLIDDDGQLILTIGYLILEAEQVSIELDDGRVFPASVVAYDQASGFGLVRSLAPLPRPAAPLGRSAALPLRSPLMIASGGSDGDLSIARLVSRRPFTGFWEYHIDGALFTAPARDNHSGAALFSADGELLGIGSLVVGDAGGPDRPPLGGNMFVPVDLLLPILTELRERGSSSASQRAWLGVQCVEAAGEIRIVRISADSPADAAGLRPGDHIVALDGRPVPTLEQLYKQLWQGSPPDREVSLEIRRDGAASTVKLQATDRRHTLRHARGI